MGRQKRKQTKNKVDKLENIGALLDDQFEIPFTNIRIGLDPIIGLLPFGGDWLTGLMSLYILFEAYRLGLRTTKLLTLGGRIILDIILGTIPLVGDGFDLFYRANRKNIETIKNELPTDSDISNRSRDYTGLLALCVIASVSILLLSLPFILVFLLAQ